MVIALINYFFNQAQFAFGKVGEDRNAAQYSQQRLIIALMLEYILPECAETFQKVLLSAKRL